MMVQIGSKVRSGEMVVSTTAQALPNQPAITVTLMANPDNVDDIAIGGTGVTLPDKSNNSTAGILLEPGDKFTIPGTLRNTNQIYVIGGNATDSIIYFVTQ